MVEIEAVEDQQDGGQEEPKRKEETGGEKEASSDTPEGEWSDLMGDNIQMKIISESKDAKEVQPQDAVVIDFIGRLAPNREDAEGPIFQEGKDWLIVIGDKYVIPALEMGVRFMKDQQKAVIWSHSKFAFGVTTRKHDEGFELPINSNVRYEVHVKKIFCPDDGSDDPDGFQLKLAFSKKLIANDMFKNELYKPNAYSASSEQRAIRLYTKAADEMVHMLQTHEAEKEKEGENYKEPEGRKEKATKAMEIMMDSLNNVVAVYMKAKKYHEAKEAAVKVLTHDPQNYKALLRAAKATMMDPASSYEESDVAIAAAEKVVTEKDDLDDKEVRKLRQELKQKKQEYKKRQKEMMARMTKELKPKEGKQQQESDTQQSAEGGGAKGNEQGEAATDNNKTEEGEEAMIEEEEEKSPMWRRVLPYAIQIVFPFVLYYLVTSTAKQQHTELEESQSNTDPYDEF
ncbi:Peptidyl-prolyl cis-trans isomerase [Seminavis robusta]|uniref:peptidylprolyl isomerase n=1 Tax=Seminavis robusta TaxID=568900 RepID=A0A9N8EM16_9STRA|nr:Peptidyl-prolyl cis-trans isomerase [Seminavis robusta]|eukprot:Sro1384_g268100.1 Peptidyl-prolyl cis-trans isomerase (457) ;mRNA; f:16569-18011